jgi:hypothetical protein
MTIYPNMPLSAEIQRQATVSDAYGQDRLGAWSTIATVNIGLDLNNKKVTETINNRDEANSDGLCWLPAGTDILPTDRLVVTVLAITYIFQVFGPPSIEVDLRDGSIHHLECRIRRYVG